MVGSVCAIVATIDPCASEWSQILDTLNDYVSECRIDQDCMPAPSGVVSTL